MFYCDNLYIKSKNLAFYKMILAEDTTNPTFYAYFRGFMALFLGFGLKAFVFRFVAVPAKWIRTSRWYVQNIYTYNNAYTDVFQTDFG